MSGRAQLELEGATLAVGESVRMVCPFCGGGSTSEATLVLTHCDDGGLLFVCHRARCTARGRIGGSFSGPNHVRQRPVPQLPSIPARGPVPHELASFLARKYWFGSMPRGWQYSEEVSRVLMPVMSPRYTRRGWVGRAFNRSPKTLNYKEVFDEPWAHWAQIFAGKGPVFVVEDMISAERLRERGQTACALMGVHASDDVVAEIAHNAGMLSKAVIIALDRDALSNGLALRDRMFHQVGGRVMAVILDKDIKDHRPEELEAWLNVVC